MNKLEKQLREAILASGKSLSQLGQATGVDAGRLSRFMRGERGLTLEAAGQLCQLLGLEFCRTDASGSASIQSPAAQPARPRGGPRKADGGQGEPAAAKKTQKRKGEVE